MRLTALRSSFLLALAGTALAACGDSTVNPDASMDGSADAMAHPDAGHDFGPMVIDSGPSLLRPCTTDAQCADRVDCTRDMCGSDGYCRNTVDLTVCDDGIFCNGIEQCDLVRGCVAGPPEACNDMDVCTLDRCDETMHMCVHGPRDLDMDGDPDWHCTGGGDCDDLDPAVNSHSPELCGDGLDNNCNGMIDEMPCGAPPHDNCTDPLDVSAGGVFPLSTVGVTADYVFPTCTGGSAYKDLVLTFTLTSPMDVTLSATATMTEAMVALETTCGSVGTPLTCNTGFPSGVVRRRSLPAGTYFAIVGTAPFTPTGDSLVVTAEFDPPTSPPANESCTSPQDITGGGHYTGSFVDVTDDVSIPCNPGSSPDLVYSFTTTMPQDVTIRATASTPTTTTSDQLAVCVRSTCTGGGEVRCTQTNSSGTLSTTLHSLPAGTWFLVLESPSSSAADFAMDVSFTSPTPVPPGDDCSVAIPLTPGVSTAGTLGGREDDLDTTCGYHYVDMVYTFTIAADSDVTVDVDGGTMYFDAELRSTCNSEASEIQCRGGAPTSLRTRHLTAGTYYVVVESPFGSAFHITLLVTTPPVVPTPVTGNDTCATAYTIPATGGTFSGDTTSFLADYPIPMCSAMSHDAAYVLTLTASKHVVIHTDGTSFEPVIGMFRDSCTLSIIYCSNDFGSGAAHDAVFDHMLSAGTYYFIVNGFLSSSIGPYIFDVTVSDP